jgi:hypothetical protein
MLSWRNKQDFGTGDTGQPSSQGECKRPRIVKANLMLNCPLNCPVNCPKQLSRNWTKSPLLAVEGSSPPPSHTIYSAFTFVLIMHLLSFFHGKRIHGLVLISHVLPHRQPEHNISKHLRQGAEDTSCLDASNDPRCKQTEYFQGSVYYILGVEDYVLVPCPG